ncbi:NRDE family protein [uncultured Trichococcus sp.]|uniref:NRDE family protein n=1 Tax=uncultured Trichococcus sp. TaxID=189665 RepID=UPI00338EF67A
MWHKRSSIRQKTLNNAVFHFSLTFGACYFIRTERYGTRSTTLILIDHSDRVTFVERCYLPDGTSSDVRFNFLLMAEEK